MEYAGRRRAKGELYNGCWEEHQNTALVNAILHVNSSYAHASLYKATPGTLGTRQDRMPRDFIQSARLQEEGLGVRSPAICFKSEFSEIAFSAS